MNPIEYQEVQKINILINSLSKYGYLHKNFAIYGIGAVAKKLIDTLTNFNIIGLMDKDPNNMGKFIYGFKVLSYQDVVKNVDAIIIASNEIYWSTIFERISFLKYEHGKEIFYLNGERAIQEDNSEGINKNNYWKNSIHTLRNLINENEVISFDVFDTILTRKIARPEDLLYITEQRIKEMDILDIDFVSVRREAEDICRKDKDKYCNIHQIYKQLQNMINLSDNLIEQLKQLEIEAEIEYVVPRKDIVECFYYCLNQNKKVYLISDFHLPSQIISKLLKKCGIDGYDDIFISCDVKASKVDGSMWQRYNDIMKGKKCLHIGDNETADIINATSYGITTFRVMSGYELLLSSTMKNIVINVCGAYDSLILGLIINHIFNSPFALSKSKGKPVIDDLFSFGYLFFGPIVLEYFIWLINETQKDNIEKILFLAREGYFLEKLYKKIVEKLNIKNIPEGVYFKTSRRMATVPSLRTKEDIFRNLNDSFSGTIEELLYNRFGVLCKDAAADDLIVNFDKKVKNIIEKYKVEILENAAAERESYLMYINKLQLNKCKKIALADTGIKGTIQYYLSKLIDVELVGYYFTAYTGEENPYGLGSNIKALYPEKALVSSNQSNMLKNHILFESTFVAPEGMYVKVDLDGKFVNGPQFSNQKIFDKKSLIHNGIEAFILDMLDLDKNILNSSINKKLIDELYGLPVSGKCHIEKHIKDVFFVDEMFGRISEKKIWD